VEKINTQQIKQIHNSEGIDYIKENINKMNVCQNNPNIKEEINNSRNINNHWTTKEKKLLIRLCNSTMNKKWKKIANIIGTKTPHHCANKYNELKNKIDYNKDTKVKFKSIKPYVSLSKKKRRKWKKLENKNFKKCINNECNFRKQPSTTITGSGSFDNVLKITKPTFSDDEFDLDLAVIFNGFSFLEINKLKIIHKSINSNYNINNYDRW
jgi:hypothetical protein